MIQFCLPPPATAAGGPGLTYACRMAEALTTLGLPASVDATATAWPAAGPIVIDGLLLPTLPITQCAGAVGLLHHAASRPIGGERPGIEQALRDRLPALRRVLCTSQSTADRVLATFGITAVVVPPGADRLPAAVRPPGPVRILSAGVLTARKGHDTLIQALSCLPDLDWTLTIAGQGGRDPAWEAALSHAATQPGAAGRVSVIRDPDRAALDALYASAGLFVLLTRWEGYPAAVAEALGRAIPVVTTAAGTAGLPPGALVVDLADLPTLSKTLRRAVFDPALRHSLAVAAARAGAALPEWATQAALFAAALA